MKKKKSKGRRIFRIIVFSLFGLVVCTIAGIFVYAGMVEPFLLDYGKHEVNSLASTTLNRAVFDAVDSSIAYETFLTLEKNDQQAIVGVTTNTAKVNRFVAEVVNKAEEYVGHMAEQKIYVPVGTLLGTPLFAGLGPSVSMEVIPVGKVEGQIVSSFSSAGYNQTKHSLYLDLSVAVRVVLPGGEDTVYASGKVLIGECVLIGEVPRVLLENAIPEKALDLFP